MSVLSLFVKALMAMSVSLFIRELKYWWVPLIEGSVSLLSAAIILLVGEQSEIVNFAIGGWAISKALLSLTEFGIYQSEIKRVWLLYVKKLFFNFISTLGPTCPYLWSAIYYFVYCLLLFHSRNQLYYPLSLWIKGLSIPSRG